MRGKRYSVEQIMRILRAADGGKTIVEVCREHNISEQTFHKWKRKYQGMELADAKKLKALEEENSRLKRLVAEKELDIQILKEVNSKKW